LPPAVTYRPGTSANDPIGVHPTKTPLAGLPLNSAVEEISDSWLRCRAEYHVDPKSRSAPNVVTESELKVSREPLGDVILHAREEIDRLYAIVRQQGYVVLLCNQDGVAIHHRGDEARAQEFKDRGIWIGGVWSEQIEGTNGIGTCITEQRSVLVHCGQHYRNQHSDLTCAGAPIFDPFGNLAGVLDVSAIVESPGQTQQLALAATVASARAVEERLFRESFRHSWVIAAIPADESCAALLLAVDDDQRIVGADRAARSAFSISEKNVAEGAHLSGIFDCSRLLFLRDSDNDIPVRLNRAGRDDQDEQWHALITPPLARPVLSRRSAEVLVHSRPRLSMLGDMPAPEGPRLSRGGLSPALRSRIYDYIESHLEAKISLEGLSSMAGLSPYHFARAFRQSFGTPPHGYLLQRRLERVKELIRDSKLPLSQIALATGFSDQSHLARHFRRQTGMSPSLARWEQR
jgi:AraC-like DNA-binding protein